MSHDKRVVLDMHQSSNDALLIDGSAGTVYSKPVRLNDFNVPNGELIGKSTEIGINIHGVVVTLTGNLQAVNATSEADIAEASTKWSNIDGGDLSNWDIVGGCTVLKAPYTHIRAKIDTGKCSIALTSNTEITEL